MTWLDSVLALPLIGLQIKPSFKTSMAYADLLADLLDELLAEGNQVTIQPGKPVGMRVSLDTTGYALKFEINNIVAEHSYLLKGNLAPGELPIFEDISSIPYSECVEGEVGLLIRALEALASKGAAIELSRFGLVAHCVLKDDQAPPGIEILEEKLWGKWNHPLKKMDSMVLAVLHEGGGVTDQCHHRLIIDPTRQPETVQLYLDWQRLYAEPILLDTKTMTKTLRDGVTSALDYFEQVAEGGFDDAREE